MRHVVERRDASEPLGDPDRREYRLHHASSTHHRSVAARAADLPAALDATD